MVRDKGIDAKGVTRRSLDRMPTRTSPTPSLHSPTLNQWQAGWLVRRLVGQVTPRNPCSPLVQGKHLQRARCAHSC